MDYKATVRNVLAYATLAATIVVSSVGCKSIVAAGFEREWNRDGRGTSLDWCRSADTRYNGQTPETLAKAQADAQLERIVRQAEPRKYNKEK